ncbi:PP2C family protein-serine/threonine phosphatase [Thermincola potens]|uniref:Protein serine/threonine phosphatase n=1 Tax=Thermincola potens (strain JR) TaxID=635013 RepID=D5X9R3_THEPJ|nr:PP2C family protein-serine/threonine phosphatase [Thermincola potens]ADG81134.1 protein serine/threonine phosphatase [Thermincola potens JR]
MTDEEKTREQLIEELKLMRRLVELFTLTPLCKSNDRLFPIQALVEDITDREKAEEALRLIEKRYRDIVEEIVQKDRRIQKELQLANTIQSSLFPVNLPQVPGATLAATAVSANEVGGDYCDLFVTKNKKLGIAIGDVMGKGVPAALFVAMTYAFVRNYAFDLESPSALVNRVNRSLFPQLEFAEQFITFFYGLYNPETRELRYANAGHNPPIIYRADKDECEKLQLRDFFMGGRQDAQYREGACILNPGDVTLFYTDGLKEGKNRAKEQFGMERITKLLKESHIYDPASIQELISYEFMDFLAGEPPCDDVTMIVIKIDG